jgi:hypothetical protein
LAGVTNGTLDSNTQPTLNEWHLVTATYSSTAGRMRIWIDNTKVAERTDSSGSISTTTDNLHIGTKTPSSPTGDFFDGRMDDVRIYDRELNQDEIAMIVDSNTPFSKGCRLWLKFDDGSGSTARDDSGGVIGYFDVNA